MSKSLLWVCHPVPRTVYKALQCDHLPRLAELDCPMLLKKLKIYCAQMGRSSTSWALMASLPQRNASHLPVHSPKCAHLPNVMAASQEPWSCPMARQVRHRTASCKTANVLISLLLPLQWPFLCPTSLTESLHMARQWQGAPQTASC